MLLLKNHKGYNWHSDGKTFFKGFFFLEAKLYAGLDALNFLNQFDDNNLSKELIIKLNGHFSIIRKKHNYIFACVDRTRTFPLFYVQKPDGIIISDNTCDLLPHVGSTGINHFAKSQFLATGYTLGKSTLIEEINQIEPGQYLVCNGKTYNTKFYYNYLPEKQVSLSYPELKISFNKNISELKERLKLILNNKTPVVPLSSGYDSRFIVALLKLSGIENVICVTFGKENNSEIEVSKLVAEKLGYRWVFIQYKSELVSNYIDNKVFKEFYKYSSNHSSMFYMQEYFAVKELFEQKIIPDNSLFLPGHMGDFIAGSHLWGDLSNHINLKKVARKIYNRNFVLVQPDKKNKRAILDYLFNQINTYGTCTYAKTQNWELKERQPKFILNSSNVFSFFGFEYYMPLCDIDFTGFFTNLPYKYLVNRNFYTTILSEEYFSPLGIDFNRKALPNAFTLKLQLVKSTIKQFLPWHIKKLFFHHEDTFNYREITKEMIKDMKSRNFPVNEHVQFENSYIVQWLVSVLEKR
ncbi:MAG: hypothetical protein JXB34_15450 [Bacteroidales bacterium]|nr:hypothetical protein [Bacteroidales bacterium]